MAADSGWPGYFVAVCGIDGSGKTTQIERIEAQLAGRGEVLRTRQPSDLYRQDLMVRRMLDMEETDCDLMQELALLAAFDRARHVRETVRPVLERGGAVVTDRYVYTSYAYFQARGLDDLEWLLAVNRTLPTPDLTVYMDVPAEVAAERIIARDGSSKKREELDLDRMSAVRAAFLERSWEQTPGTFHAVDSTQPLNEVTAQVLELVQKHDPR